MATMAQERELREVAKIIKKKLKRIYGVDMGFFLNVTPMGEQEGIADYISNVERETSIEWMKETIGRFERNETIEAAKDGGTH